MKWGRTNKGTPQEPRVRCRLVAQELAYGQRMDELFSGTPSLMCARLALHHAAKGGGDYQAMILDVKCAFLYGEARRRIYIEPPTQDERSHSGKYVGILRKAMYGCRDSPMIWNEHVRGTMTEAGMEASLTQPSMYFNKERRLLVVVHVDDFLCAGPKKELEWLFETLSQKYEMSKKILGPEGVCEAKYLNRIVCYDEEKEIYTMEGDAKHADIVKK